MFAAFDRECAEHEKKGHEWPWTMICPEGTHDPFLTHPQDASYQKLIYKKIFFSAEL